VKDEVYYSSKDVREHGGKLAYESYKEVFGALHSYLQWEELDELSRIQWLRLYISITSKFVTEMTRRVKDAKNASKTG
jgi:hypothetical protein